MSTDWVVVHHENIEDALQEDNELWAWTCGQWDYEAHGRPSEVWQRGDNGGVTGIPGAVATTESAARLMAASHKLLEAMEYALPVLEIASKNGLAGSETSALLARAAIRKATEGE